jgi:hypothetical protein
LISTSQVLGLQVWATRAQITQQFSH